MYILGIGDVIHDRSVCLMKGGEVICAIEEERLSRIKHNIKLNSDKYTISEQGEDFFGQLKELTVATREEKFEELIKYCFDENIIPWGSISTVMISSLFNDMVFRHKALNLHHHVAHAASTFFPSPFESAAVLVIDGYGSYTEGVSESIMYAAGKGNQLSVIDVVTGYPDFTSEEKKSGLSDTHIIFKNSIGVFYQNISMLIGMQYFGEGKTMALAALGESRKDFDKIREFITFEKEGKLKIDNRSIFNYCSSIIGKAKQTLKSEQLFKLYADLAFKHQELLEEMIIHCCNFLYESTGEKALCLAGGVALNSVANYKILQATPFEKIFIQPAPGDNGISIGCAMYAAHAVQNHPRASLTKPFSPYLGKKYPAVKIQKDVDKYHDQLIEHTSCHNVYECIANLISQGKVIGWFNGCSEIGPRALGNRSILADPRREDMKSIINEKVKHRETFRPFAPAILEDKASDYFELNCTSPYMLLVPKVKPEMRHLIPAVLHVDGSARVQTVSQTLNPDFFELIHHFYLLTDIPILLNTSFNGKGEPIVETPEDAIKCFMKNEIDVLVLNGRIFSKK